MPDTAFARLLLIRNGVELENRPVAREYSGIRIIGEPLPGVCNEDLLLIEVRGTLSNSDSESLLRDLTTWRQRTFPNATFSACGITFR